MKTIEIEKALKKRYIKPEWVLLFEVSNGTGGNISRYADAIAFNMYPSKGLEITGMEIKVSRGDLLKELKTPEKADEIGKYCDTWDLVTPKGLIKDSDEIPSYWGILEVDEDLNIRRKKRATKKEAKEVNKSFMAAILRRAADKDIQKINELALELSNKKIESMKKIEGERIAREVVKKTRENQRMMEKLKKLEEKTGIELDLWFCEKEVIKCFEFAMKNKIFGWNGFMTGLNNLKNTMEKLLD